MGLERPQGRADFQHRVISERPGKVVKGAVALSIKDAYVKVSERQELAV